MSGPTANRVDLRCSECGKKLAVMFPPATGRVETMCPRCKCIDVWDLARVHSTQDGGHALTVARTTLDGRRS